MTFLLAFPLFSLRAQPALAVTGEVAKPLTLAAEAIRGLPHSEITAKDRDGKEHRYKGVPLVDILRLAGVSLGGDLRGENLAKYVLVKASDGYEVLFALPEIDPDFTVRTILLADAADGAPLPQGVGPYRLIVPDEKKPARWIRQVAAIEVRFAK
ncbi:molybdopterin-dependent oxidoreductase [Tellurirhabdus bombi]|uniref:molybdopterin-dependent oxidoreductase n=1 Tax=Tellurirhabdus bombi TaxID=2907205 RepID=UPI001F1DAB82|nr:molybdopterin-dependent oxidoreductase [Tellurirhabdus bombi]